MSTALEIPFGAPAVADGEMQRAGRALAGAGMGVFELDLASRIVWLSSLALEIFGLPAAAGAHVPDELLRARVHRADRNVPLRAFLRSLHRDRDGIFECEFRVADRGGRPRWLRLQGVVTFDYDVGVGRRPRGLTGTVHEIARPSAHPMSTILHTLGEASDALLYVKDRAGRMLYCSPAVLRALNRRREDVIGHTDFEICGGGARTAEIVAHDRLVMSTGTRSFFEERCDQDDRVYFSTKTPWRDEDGKIVGVAGVSIDVTAQRERALALEEKLRDENRHKDEFVAMLAHELRNPLGPLRNAAEVMGRTALPPQKYAWLQQLIVRQVGHMTRIVDDLLDVSRVTAGKMMVAKSRVELAPLLEGTLDSAAAFTQPRRQSVAFSRPPEALWVEGDPVRLTQVVVNLLHNASKFSDDGAEIELCLAAEGGDVVVSVTDHGRGIEPELLPHVFELFTQGYLGQAKGGLGIGLSLVRNLTRMHGGTVSVSSEGPGKGARFEVRLPRIAPERPAA